MNRKGNDRYLETERAIRAAAIELLAKTPDRELNVSDICQRAGINRSSFYLHYVDVCDMMDKIEAEMSREMAQAFVGAGKRGINQGFVNVFSYIKDNAAFYKAYFAIPARQRIFPFVLPEQYSASLAQLRAQIGLTLQSEFDYQENFFLAGCAQVTKMWLASGCRESPEEITRILLGIFAHVGDPAFDWS